MAKTTVLCPCGVAIGLPEHEHKGRLQPGEELCHDCIWHDSTVCKVCAMLAQVQDYLAVAWYCPAEAEQIVREEQQRKTKGVWE